MQLGIDPSITQVLVALGRRDQDGLLDAAANLGPKIKLPATLARSVCKLANSFSKESGRMGIKMFVNTILSDPSLNKSHFVGADLSNSDLNKTLKQVNGKETKVLFPLMIAMNNQI